MNVWVIIPAYNEGSRVLPVIKAVKKYAKNIVVVDDGSKDNTLEIAKSQKIHTLHHILNLGKGAALKTGCDFACEQGATHLIVIDADGQHEPQDIPRFIKVFEEKKDIVFTYRAFSKKMPGVLRFGNWFISFIIYILYGLQLKDTQCGYRGFTSEAYKKIRWAANDYSMESEMIANAGKYCLKYKELKIKTIYADRYKGTTPLDGIKIVFRMLLMRLRI